MKREEFEAKHGRLPPHAVYIDLDDPRNQVPPEPVTAGWTDTQIRGKSLAEIQAQIDTGEKGLASLKETIRAEEKRVDDLRLIKARKLQIGD